MGKPASLSSATANEPASSTELPAAPRGFRLGYQPGLDGLRATSLVLIMMFHSFILWGPLYGRVVPGAYIAVNMFFVLSGFLITSILLTELDRQGRVSFRSFYQRRALRLLPALVLLLAAFTLYVFVMHRGLIGDELAAVGWISVYGANWAQWAGKMQNLYTSLSLGHTWTLAVEEQFYLVWPLLIVVVLQLKPRLRALAWGLVGGVILVTLERALLATRVSIPAGASHEAAAQIFERSIGIRTDLRADTLLLGALAAVLLHAGWRPGRGVRLAGTAALAFLVIMWLAVQPDARWMYQWGFTVVDAAGALLCVAVLDRTWRVGWVFRTRPAAWLGRMSYALYLWHLPVFVAIAVDAPGMPVGVALALAWIITFACAIASYYLVETRFLRLKGRLSERAYGTAAEPRLAPQAATQPTSR